MLVTVAFGGASGTLVTLFQGRITRRSSGTGFPRRPAAIDALLKHISSRTLIAIARAFRNDGRFTNAVCSITQIGGIARFFRLPLAVPTFLEFLARTRDF